jgi:hypothetical protein
LRVVYAPRRGWYLLTALPVLCHYEIPLGPG